MPGLIHLYSGDGKGKTTAALGLSMRAAGAGKRVLFAQFMKDGTSSEIAAISANDNITVRVCETPYGFVSQMDSKHRASAERDFTELLRSVIFEAGKGFDLLVLDEAIPACNCGLIPMELVLNFLRNKPAELEVVLTGRNPPAELVELADYVTEMKKLKHPYDKGTGARRGIEF